MKNRIVKRVCMQAAIAVCVMGFCMVTEPIPCYAMETEQESVAFQSVEPRSTYRWIYSYIGGQMYKRLQNTETGEWVSDWILCE